jgi:hypothetical protein
VLTTLTLKEKTMEKYIKGVLQSLVFLIVAVSCFTLINVVTKDKLERLISTNLLSVGSIGEFKAALKDKERRMQCMTQNIYWEAAGEPAEGKIAVAQVVMNRVESGKFPSDPCLVVHQKNVVYEKVLCQFSWYCEQNFKIKPVHKKLWDDSAEAAKMVMVDGFRLPELKGALYYHADYVNPQWNKEKVATIGRHIFYK